MASIARWPCIPFIDAAPLDPNFGLHALASASYSGNHTSQLLALGYPDGIPAQYIAIPTLLMAKVIGYFFSPVAATNLAVWIWLALQGFGVALLFKKEKASTQYLLATAAILNPINMVALGNGQWENVACWPIIWTALSLKEARWLQFVIALLLASSCSPYVLLAALICCTPFLWPMLKHPALYICIGVAAFCSWFYYSGADEGNSAHIGPAPSSMQESAQISGLIIPFNHAEDGGIPLSGPTQRLKKLTQIPTQKTYNADWPWQQATAGSYLGMSLLVLGFLGWKKRKNNTLIWGFGISILLALGSYIPIYGINIPLPWAINTWTPLKNMAATYRFLAATTAILILCISDLKWSKKYTSIAILTLIFDAILISPAHWPIAAFEGKPPNQPNLNIDGPVAFWPAAPLIAPHSIIMMSLVLDQPLALFEDPNARMPTASGSVAGSTHKINRLGETPDQWRQRLISEDVTYLIQFKNMVGERAHPFYAHPETCGSYFCVISLLEQEKP